MPEERHLGRMAALYVDPISPTEWNRPTEKITQEFARDVLLEASNDYSLEADQGYFNLEIVATRDAELADALSKWLDRPLPPCSRMANSRMTGYCGPDLRIDREGERNERS